MAVMEVEKRDGRIVPFDQERIYSAVEKALREAKELGATALLPRELTNIIWDVTESVQRKFDGRNRTRVEDIQDEVEKALAAHDQFDVARKYIVYRDKRNEERTPVLRLVINGKESVISYAVVTDQVKSLILVDGITDNDIDSVVKSVWSSLQHGMTGKDLDQAVLYALRERIEREPKFSKLAAMHVIYSAQNEAIDTIGSAAFGNYILYGIEHEVLDPRLGEVFDLAVLQRHISTNATERNTLFDYLGIQTLYDRYFLQVNGKRIETPQFFWMRVAMGLSLNETLPNERAIEFYDALSTFKLCSSTPTLFNSGTLHPQMSSCYLLTQDDDLHAIFKNYADSAQLSKWAGGIGTDFTPVRALNSHIKGVNGKSSGTIPFLKIMNDTVAGVSQAGKRRGSAAAYMEIWHADIERFLDLRKGTGDERQRTHDLNTAVWVNDLFMERVKDGGQWTLLSPNDAPTLHDMYGEDFKRTYQDIELRIDCGEWTGIFKRVDALTLWRQILGSLFETGHPWVTFKDPSNLRYSNSHKGVVHSSNLCTEILLHTNKDEVAVCNLLSVNVANAFNSNGTLDREGLKKTINTAMRMLDNVIDINFYPIPEARTSNLLHRPVGLGIMGFQEALWLQNYSYASQEAVEFADQLQEYISYYAIEASARLAFERGPYQTYEGSLWSKGVFPIDSIKYMNDGRTQPVGMNTDARLGWADLREYVQNVGMRNSNVMAIAPTATISNIQGVTQSIEPIFSNLFVKQNLSGAFTVTNKYLVADLQELGLWDDTMLEELKYWEGSVQFITRIPEELRRKYPTAFEIDSNWLIEAASRRQKWIDMGQSLNLYIDHPDGKLLNDMYFHAWEAGLKTTYYLRSKGVSNIEKSSIDVNKFGTAPRWMKNKDRVEINIEKPVTPVEETTVYYGGDSSYALTKSLSDYDIPYDDMDDLLCEACQ